MIHQPAWLLLVHQLPARPSNVRVKTWRRLQKIGALPVKNSVYVLPHSAQAREDFEWLKTEIESLKGQATVFAADHIDSLSGEEIMNAFRNARQKDYAALRDAARRVRPSRRREKIDHARRLLHARCAEIETVDFFSAPGREEAVAAISALDRRLEKPSDARTPSKGGGLPISAYQGRRWVTRPRPGVDRMSSAWLIRRFIDPRAKFCFASKPEEAPGATPFDMFGVEFSHQGPDCTFETFQRRFRLRGPAFTWMGRIVHQLDVKDESIPLPEAPAIGRLIDGLRRSYADDHELLETGIRMFEALYRSFDGAKKKG